MVFSLCSEKRRRLLNKCASVYRSCFGARYMIKSVLRIYIRVAASRHMVWQHCVRYFYRRREKIPVTILEEAYSVSIPIANVHLNYRLLVAGQQAWRCRK